MCLSKTILFKTNSNTSWTYILTFFIISLLYCLLHVYYKFAFWKGSCTNSRIEDLRAVVDVIKHAPEGARLVPQHIDAMVVPGSGLVKMMAEDEGIDKILVQAGFQWREPGCSMCLGKYKHWYKTWKPKECHLGVLWALVVVFWYFLFLFLLNAIGIFGIDPSFLF